MDLLKKDRIYTVEDIYALPEGERGAGRGQALLYGAAKSDTSENQWQAVSENI